MSFLQIAVLALIQGVTEFLPISSSAHLILVPYFVGWTDQGLHFDVATNTGTTLAVLLFFRSDLAVYLREGLESLKIPVAQWSREARHAWWLLLATLPVAVCGLVFFDWISTSGRDPRILATTSILFGLLLFWAERAGRNRRPLEDLKFRDTVFIGLAEALALIPGTSRSGVTITAGLASGFTRVAAARFSFLLAVPVGIMAAAKDFWELAQAPPPSSELGALALGALIAGVSAYAAIGWLLAWVRRQRLTIFVVYRVLLGLIIFAVWASTH